MQGDLISVTEAAKALGLPRTTLTKILDEAHVQKLKQGRENLVSFIDAKKVVDEAVRKGRVKTKVQNVSGNAQNAQDAGGVSANALGTPGADPRTPDEMTLFLMEQVRSIQRERDELFDKIRSLERIQGEQSVLLLAAKEKDKEINYLRSEIKELERKQEDQTAIAAAAKAKDAEIAALRAEVSTLRSADKRQGASGAADITKRAKKVLGVAIDAWRNK